ncbi:unnamed protein product [Peronospora belbahrii]|uniref:PX domain-containing protein n=1 Tax=Peronospora belbahrii TaxID=622444 RepID=A0AAU9KKE0_9STRA|nr:unnamed protein product [Peronospora belbahrii]CAH0513313.1 unnamed protein product [Peronospora belbahrii]
MTNSKKSGSRRLKQMQGLLLLSRLDCTPARRHLKLKPQRMMVLLQPQLLQLTYSSLADQDMLQPLGRIDLRDAKLEQVPDGFIIYEAGKGLHKKLKLQDKDKATTDAWFFAVYTAITEYERLSISSSEDVGHKFSAVLSSRMRDEHTETVEFELSCQLLLPTRPIDKPSIKWKVWKTFSEFHVFDDELRVSYGAHMKQITLPRDRKRDSLFGGMRKKSLQELKEQQLALYVEQVFQMPVISSAPILVDKIKHFLGFDSFFKIVASSSSDSDENSNKLSELPTSANLQSESCLSIFADAVEVSEVSQPPKSNDSQGLSQPAAEPMSSESHASSGRYPSTKFAGVPPASLIKKRSTALGYDSEEFVDVIPETDPKAAKKLHKKIIQTVCELVANDEERVRDFQDQTKDFGREKTSAMEYCAFLLGAVGAQECCKLIQEMARLLPNEEKREELMQARAAIWRRTHRRHRRRSKQFSESIVMEKEKREQQLVEVVSSRTRTKSESCSTLNWDSERVRPLTISRRNSMAEKRIPATDSGFYARSNKSVPASPAPRGLADPRRHLNRRASFNTFFGETLQTGPIEEENPADNESDGDSDDSLVNGPRTLSKNNILTERELSLSENTCIGNRSDLGRRKSSFLDEEDEDASTDDDDENHHSSRSLGSRHSYHRQHSGSRTGSCEKRVEKAKSLSRGDLTQTRSRRSSLFIEESDEEYNRDEEENSYTRFRRSQRRASRKFDEEAKFGPAAEEVNPVLARLKKQGAINFMMQLH